VKKSLWEKVLPAIEFYGIPVEKEGDEWRNVHSLASSLGYSKHRAHVFVYNYSDSPITRKNERGKWEVNYSFLERVREIRETYDRLAVELYYRIVEEKGWSANRLARRLSESVGRSVTAWNNFIYESIDSRTNSLFSLRLSVRRKTFVDALKGYLEEEAMRESPIGIALSRDDPIGPGNGAIP